MLFPFFCIFFKNFSFFGDIWAQGYPSRFSLLSFLLLEDIRWENSRLIVRDFFKLALIGNIFCLHPGLVKPVVDCQAKSDIGNSFNMYCP